MAYQKLQVGKALSIVPSVTVDIPLPPYTLNGTNTSVTGDKLVDAGAPFTTAANIEEGDIVYNTTVGSLGAAYVTAVDSTSILSLSVDIFTGTPETYTIYKKGLNNGCVLYVGTGGTLAITTVSGSRVTLVGVNSGTFIPIQVMRWTGGTAADVIALW